MIAATTRGLVDAVGMLSPRTMTIPADVTWVVAECKSRHEKALALDLSDAGFDYFLPLIRSVKQCGRKRYCTTAPIPGLNGYIFAASTDPVEEGYLVPHALHEFLLAHRSVYDLIEVSRGMQATLSGELNDLHGHIVTNPNFGEHFAVKGQPCRVVSGPFMGFEGIIDSAGDGWAILPITILGTSVPTKIPVSVLEPIDFADARHLAPANN